MRNKMGLCRCQRVDTAMLSGFSLRLRFSGSFLLQMFVGLNKFG